jgi:hypothetical protein
MKKSRNQNKFEEELLTFKMILELNNNWDEYVKKYKVRDVEKYEVEKMLSCRNPEKIGYTTYLCSDCGEPHVLAHSCKSRICSSCGKRHADEWAEKINAELYNVTYRHIILTISDKLWKYFEGNSELQKVMLDTASEVMKEIVNNFSKSNEDIVPGMILVLHPFGKDLKTNMHVHMLMTEGGLSKDENWVEVPYMDYGTIRKKWQYAILTNLKKVSGKEKELKKIIDWCFKELKNGFVIQAKRRIKGGKKQVIRYMARYVRHPAIADSRIVGYDTKNVIFIYEKDGKEVKVIMDKFEFIHNVIKHIPNKNFKMVRYFGLHSRRIKKKVKKIMGKLGKVIKVLIRPFNWRKNIEKYTGKDPLKCKSCGGALYLYKVTYRKSSGELKEYGGWECFVKSSGLRSFKESEKIEKKQKKEAVWNQLCLQ